MIKKLSLNSENIIILKLKSKIEENMSVHNVWKTMKKATSVPDFR
jgi:hypothetical protein